MPKHCSIYVFHATYELSQFSFFDISTDKVYFKVKSSSFSKSPLCQALSNDDNLKATCYFSGAYLESLKDQQKELNAIRGFVENDQIELLLGTYHHSFSCLFSSSLFKMEIAMHQELMAQEFGAAPKGFLNTAAIFSNELLPTLLKEGISYTIAPRVTWYLGNQPSSRVFKSKDDRLRLVLVGNSTDDKEVIVSYLPGYVSRHWDMETVMVSEVVAADQQLKEYSLPNPIGLDPEGRDLTHFLGNSLQKQVFKQINDLAEKVYKSTNQELKSALLTLGSPAIFDLISQEYTIRYDYYTSLMNCLTDMELRLDS